MKIGELFIALGFDVDDKKLKEFNENVTGAFKNLLKVSAAASAAVYAVNAFTASSIEAAVAQENFKTTTGESIEELQKWQVAATTVNPALSIDQVTESIKSLNGAIADVSMGKGPSGAFAMLGVDTRGKDAFQVLEEMRARYKENLGVWRNQRVVTNLLQDVGIDPGILNALKLTNDEFDRMHRGRYLNEESRQNLVGLGQAIASFKRDYALWKDQLSADISPKLIAFLNSVTPALKEFGANLDAVFDKMQEKVGPAVTYITEKLEPFKNWLILSGGLIAAAFFPLTTVFLSLVYLTNEWGKALRGLPAFQGVKDTADKLFNWVGDHTKDLFTPKFNPDGTPYTGRADLLPGHESLFYSPAYGGGMPPQPAPIQNSVTQNNTFNIEGSEFNANDVATEVVRLNQGQLNATLDEFNNGPKF